MSPEELLSGLAPIRLPEGFAAFGWRDACAMLALGLVSGLALVPLLRLVTGRRPSRRQAVQAELRRLRGLPGEDRLAGLAALLRRLAPAEPLPPDTRRALYDPAVPGDAEALERRVLRAARRPGPMPWPARNARPAPEPARRGTGGPAAAHHGAGVPSGDNAPETGQPRDDVAGLARPGGGVPETVPPGGSAPVAGQPRVDLADVALPGDRVGEAVLPGDPVLGVAPPRGSGATPPNDGGATAARLPGGVAEARMPGDDMDDVAQPGGAQAGAAGANDRAPEGALPTGGAPTAAEPGDGPSRPRPRGETVRPPLRGRGT
ncbi:hypothetical protein [Paroceanicella profunda]|uniref:hypothetical protein n=1 Tax=Paroceanicella profunda TaxID=2579971 RepID=UPI0019808813|nr:hypothetical protein [Paroceanicella profunda]